MPTKGQSSASGQEDGYASIGMRGGVDNRSHETKIEEGFVRHADNVEIDKDGVSTLRSGYSQAAALINAHSLWSCHFIDFGLVADANTLYRIDPSGALTPLVTDLSGGDVSYEYVAHQVHWSNGDQTGRVSIDGKTSAWGVETPLPSFELQAVANGGLHAGTYGLTFTFANALREESGAPASAFVDVAEGGGIQVNGVPTPQGSGIVQARVYVTTPNGEEMFYAASSMPGAATFLVGAGERGKLLTTLFCEQFPAARQLLLKHGRMFGVIGRRVIWSEALYYGVYKPTDNYIVMPDEVVMLCAPETEQFHVYIGTRTKVYAWRGDSFDMAKPSIVSDKGVVPGSMTMVPAPAIRLQNVYNPVPVWVGTDGIPYAGTELGVVPLSELFVYPIYDKAASAFVEQDGLSRYIVSGRGGRTSGLAMTDTAIATVTEP